MLLSSPLEHIQLTQETQEDRKIDACRQGYFKDKAEQNTPRKLLIYIIIYRNNVMVWQLLVSIYINVYKHKLKQQDSTVTHMLLYYFPSLTLVVPRY